MDFIFSVFTFKLFCTYSGARSSSRIADTVIGVKGVISETLQTLKRTLGHEATLLARDKAYEVRENLYAYVDEEKRRGATISVSFCSCLRILSRMMSCFLNGRGMLAIERYPLIKH